MQLTGIHHLTAVTANARGLARRYVSSLRSGQLGCHGRKHSLHISCVRDQLAINVMRMTFLCLVLV